MPPTIAGSTRELHEGQSLPSTRANLNPGDLASISAFPALVPMPTSRPCECVLCPESSEETTPFRDISLDTVEGIVSFPGFPDICFPFPGNVLGGVPASSVETPRRMLGEAAWLVFMGA